MRASKHAIILLDRGEKRNTIRHIIYADGYLGSARLLALFRRGSSCGENCAQVGIGRQFVHELRLGDVVSLNENARGRLVVEKLDRAAGGELDRLCGIESDDVIFDDELLATVKIKSECNRVGIGGAIDVLDDIVAEHDRAKDVR